MESDIDWWIFSNVSSIHCNTLQHTATHCNKSQLNSDSTYGVAMISRLLKNSGLFCKIWSLLWGSFARETYGSREPTTRSHPIVNLSSRQTFENFDDLMKS